MINRSTLYMIVLGILIGLYAAAKVIEAAKEQEQKELYHRGKPNFLP